MCLLVIGSSVWAVEPDEILPDVLQESRAREISKELRCLVCRNENIDSSNAGIAKDLRVLVRERIVAGDTDDQVIEFVVDRYGEFVLLKPQFSISNFVLWAAGPLFLLLGGVIGWRFTRATQRSEPDVLSASEKERLDKLLDD
jgi:cytochrome c-type biogenesis protein CcmH